MIVRDLLTALLADPGATLNSFVLLNGKPADSVVCEDRRMLITQIPQIEPRKAVEGEPPTTFRFNADITFEAHSAEEAFERLSIHFNSLTRDDQPSLNYAGVMQLRPDSIEQPLKNLTKKQLKKLHKRFSKSTKK